MFSLKAAHFQVDNKAALSHFDENGRDWKQEDNSSGQGNLGIRSISEDHNYCRVSARKIEYESLLGVQEFSGFRIFSDLHNRASTPAQISRTFGRSQGTSTSSSVEQDFKTNGLENFRKNLVEKGISNTAANRISNSRRSGTTANYQSIERQIDPVLYYIFWTIYLKTNMNIPPSIPIGQQFQLTTI